MVGYHKLIHFPYFIKNINCTVQGNSSRLRSASATLDPPAKGDNASLLPLDDFVRSSDVFNRDVGRAVNPAAEELKSIEPTETQPDAKPETAAEPKADIFNPGEMTDEEWFAYRKSIAPQG